LDTAGAIVSTAETVPVTFTLDGIERVQGAGRMVALAIVTLEVAGVEITLQGVQVRRRVDGGLKCPPPTFRHPRTGLSVPCMVLPPALARALADDVLAAV
jgi:hypothetical protein